MRTLSDKSTAPQKLFASLILLVGVALLFVALPKLRAALSYQPVDYAIDKINDNEILDDEKLDQLIGAARTSISLDDNPHYWEDLSVLFMYQAQKDGLSQEASVEPLKQAKHSTEQSLLHAPANTYLWYRLSVINSLLQLPPGQTVKMLVMSIMTGPNEPEILMQRLGLCLMLFTLFEEDDIGLLRDQVLTAWALSPPDFLSTVANDEAQMDVVRQLLADNNALVLEEMEEALEKTP